MRVYEAKTADLVWRKAIDDFKEGDFFSLQDSRAGNTYEQLHVTFQVKDPRQRWIVSRTPALNPAFAIAELVWFMNGRNDSTFLNYWNSQLPQYAGKGRTYHGSYGFRLKKHFKIDQLKRAYEVLKCNPDSRQVVLQFWDINSDFPKSNGRPVDADIPCNVISLIKVRNKRLDWTQIVRSNDIFLGIPYNIFLFTCVQEIIAGWLNLKVGVYHHISDSLHIYKRDCGSLKRSSPIRVELNSDSLKAKKKASEQIFIELANRMQLLAAKKLKRMELRRIANKSIKIKAYENMLFLVCAEAARKRHWQDLATEIMSRCTNPILNQVWQRWLERTV